MKKKSIKYILTILLPGIVVYNSVYFKKLDEVTRVASSKTFDAGNYARNFYNNKLLPQLGNAVDLDRLIVLLKTEPAKAFESYSHTLDIGNIRYFLVQGEGSISSIDEDGAVITLKNDSSKTSIRIATEFVYGNAIRDASGQVSLNEFSSTADFNSVSEEINKIIRNEVLPPFKAKAKPGDILKFSGAIELNQAHTKLDSVEMIPVQLTLIK